MPLKNLTELIDAGNCRLVRLGNVGQSPFILIEKNKPHSAQDTDGSVLTTGIILSAAEVERIANKVDGIEMKPFITDGCTMSPDFNFRECGVLHDLAYWAGGTRDERRAADLQFHQGVERKAGKILARIYWLGVRFGGVPWLPSPWRWGFGRVVWKLGYDKVTE